ncbi:hypothetical protein D3C76_1608570 [compost metagenome]
MERIGLEAIQAAIVDDLEMRQTLNERVDLALSQVADPWQRVRNDDELQEKLYANVELV